MDPQQSPLSFQHHEQGGTAPDYNRIMFVALLPAILMAVIFFGLGSLKVMLAAVVSCLLLEYITRKYILKISASIRSGPALITGVLLSFNLPAGLPVWMVFAGSLVVGGISQNFNGKRIRNPFNAILVSRLLLRIAFPVQMTTWPAVITETDSLTGFTPIEIVHQGLKNGKTIAQISSATNFPRYFDIFWGNVNGSLGEISVIALLIGGLYLLAKKVITWHIPVAMLGTVFLVQTILWLFTKGSLMDPVFQLITGGMTLMAFFMATDPNTSPSSPTGKLLVGVGIGMITAILRNFSGYPEEIFISILIMNGLTPFIYLKTNSKSLAEIS